MIENVIVADKFEEAVRASKSPKDSNAPKLIANWMISELFAVLNKENLEITGLKFPITYLTELVDLIIDGTISGKIAKTVFAEIFATNKAPSQIVKDMGLMQISDETVIRDVIEGVLKAHADKVAEYQSGKDKLFGFFVGVSMKALEGKGNPGVVNQILKELLQQ